VVAGVGTRGIAEFGSTPENASPMTNPATSSSCRARRSGPSTAGRAGALGVAVFGTDYLDLTASPGHAQSAITVMTIIFAVIAVAAAGLVQLAISGAREQHD
jgi:hypothetical protein